MGGGFAMIRPTRAGLPDCAKFTDGKTGILALSWWILTTLEVDGAGCTALFSAELTSAGLARPTMRGAATGDAAASSVSAKALRSATGLENAFVAGFLRLEGANRRAADQLPV